MSLLYIRNKQTGEFEPIKALKGDQGATFTPSVSEDGILSWSNDGGLANPDPFDFKGFESSINVKSFGAIGDGVVDDTIAFEQAIDKALSLATGIGWKSVPKIFIPRGTYLITRALIADEKYKGCKFIFEGEGRTNTYIMVGEGCSVLFPNDDIFGFTDFSNMSFAGADNTQTFMRNLSGRTNLAQSVRFFNCGFSKFHTVMELGVATGADVGKMASETTFSECKITSCGNADNPCEMFVLNNPQSVNTRFIATDIESFVGVLFKYLQGTSVCIYQGSIIAMSGSEIVNGLDLSGSTSGAGNQPSLTVYGARFELRGDVKLINHTAKGKLVLSFNECGMGCYNLDDGVKPIVIGGDAQAEIYFSKCKNVGTMFCEFVNINSAGLRDSIKSSVIFEHCNLNVKNFLENTTFSYTSSNGYVAMPVVMIDGVTYNLHETMRKAPMGDWLTVKERVLLNGSDRLGIPLGNSTTEKTYTADINCFVRSITFQNIGNDTWKWYPDKLITCELYEGETLLGTISGVSVKAGTATVTLDKYVGTLTAKTKTDFTDSKNPIVPIILSAVIIG